MHSVFSFLAIAGALAACVALAVDSSSLLSRAEQVTRVRIEPAAANAPRIDPRIFSDFLEHLGGAVYEGLWANAVYNPRFGTDSQGRMVRWSFSGNAATFNDPNAGTAARLPAGGETRQLISLPVHRVLTFHGAIRVRAGGASPAVLEVTLRAADKPAVIASARLQVKAPDWAGRAFKLVVPAGALERGEPAELRIAASGGDCDLTMVELFPADAIHGMDPDVVRASKDLHIELLRWPGGNFVSGYNWRNGIGPRELRPTVPNPAWAGLETHHFGTDEFMVFCRLIRAKPMICINAGSGSPEEAADWVEYCNGSAESPMGRLRAANGHPKPYNVRVWEIGNELYGAWQIGHTNPEGNAERFLRFRKAMLAKDPSIETIATGKGDQFAGGGLEFDRSWNGAVLAAASREGRAPDLLSLHPLVPLPSNLPGRFDYREIYESAMAHPHWFSDVLVPEVRAEVRERCGVDAPTRLAVTEWGIILGGPEWLRFPNHDAQSGAVYAGLFLNALLRSAENVRISNVTALMHGGGIKKWRGAVFVDPMYYVDRMFDDARPTRLLPVVAKGPSYDAPQRGFLPAVAGVPWLDVLAAESQRGVVIFVVNRDPKSPRPAQITLPAGARGAAIETLAADPQARNTFERPDAVRPVRADLQVSGRILAHNFPPCSVSVIHLK